MTSRCPFASRRAFLGGAGGLVAAIGTAHAQPAAKGISEAGQAQGRDVVEPFWGEHQAGILTAQQNHTYFATFDLATDKAGGRREAAASLDRSGCPHDNGADGCCTRVRHQRGRG